jgi:hypothetical protein
MTEKNSRGLPAGIVRDTVIAEALALLLIFFLQKTPSIV